jgi:tetratricopeptide (TPR) repeat protein
MAWKQYLLTKEYEYHKQDGERLLLDGRPGEARIELERALEILRSMKSEEEKGLESKLESISLKLTDQNLEKAREFWADGDHDTALNYFQSALGIVRSAHIRDEILIEISRLKLEIEPVEQIEALEKEVRENPSELNRIFELAMEYALSGYYERAVFELLKILEEDPENEECLLRVGNACFDGGRFLEAEEYLRKGLALDGDFRSRFLYRLGRLAVHSQRYGEAEDCFHAALELDSKDLDSLMSMARLYKKTGDWEKAIDFFERVLSVDPDDGDTLVEVAEMWEEHHFIKNAREVWTEILDKDTDEECKELAKEKLSFYEGQI